MQNDRRIHPRFRSQLPGIPNMILFNPTMDALLVFVVIFEFLFIGTSSLFCYKCNQVNGIDNILCNGNEPEYCNSLSPTCISSINSSGDILDKGCGRCPRSDRADVTCYECSGVLCNKYTREYAVQEDSPYKLYTTHHHGRLYKMFYGKLSTFWEARLQCAKDNGSLATIKSSQKQNFINNILFGKLEEEMLLEFGETEPSDTQTISMWVGGLIQGFGNWMWIDDGTIIHEADSTKECQAVNETVPYKNWNDLSDKDKSKSPCVAITVNDRGKWDQTECGNTAISFLCEIPHQLKQTVYYDGFLYTFHARKLSKSDAEDYCQISDGTLADLSVDEVKLAVRSQLAYVLQYHTIRTDVYCGYPMKSFLYDEELCRTDDIKLSFICENYEDGNNIACDVPTAYEDPPSDASATEQDPTEIKAYCPSKDVPNADHGVLQFPQTPANRISYSIQKCDLTDVHKAAMFCPEGNFDTSTLHTISCGRNITNLVEVIAEYENSTHKNETKQHSFVNLLNELAILTSTNKLNDYSHFIDAYSDIISNIQNSEKITLSDMANALTVVNNLKDAFVKNPLSNKIKDDSNRMYLIKSLEILAAKLELVDDEMHIVAADDIKVGVQRINSSSPNQDDIKFVASDKAASSSSFIAIPESSLKSATRRSKEDLRAVFFYFKYDDLHPSANTDIPSEIVAASITDGSQTYSVPVKYAMISKNTFPEENKLCWSEKCMYYDKVVPMWSEYGCQYDWEHNTTATKEDKIVHCDCNHTTSFSVVLSEFAEPSLALDIATTVGLIICIIFLTLTVILFAFSSELRKIRSAFIHANLCACLVICYFIFLIGIHRTDLESLCVTVAALIHFFIIAAWGWMVTESITMYRPGVIKSANLSFAVYVTSALIVLITFASSVLTKKFGLHDIFAHETCHLKNQDKIWSIYSGGRYCWLHGSPLYFGFLAVAGIALVFNVVVCFIIVRAITWGRKTVTTSVEESPAVHVTRAALVALLLGVTWVFAIPLVVFRDPIVQEVFGWLFAIALVFQGIFIFYFFCLRRKDVRDSWFKSVRNSVNNNFISIIRTKSSKDYVNSSFPATYFDNNSHQSSIVTPDNWRRLTSSASTKDSVKSKQSSQGKRSSQNSQNRKNSKMPVPADAKSIDEDRLSTDLVEFDGDKVFEST